MTEDRKPVSDAAPAHARKPWTAPRIQDAPVLTTTAKGTSSYESPYAKSGS
jgi:hypothetical protein